MANGEGSAKLTKTAVEGVARPGSGARVVLWDTEVKGFGVRVTATGSRTYILRYRMGGRETSLRTYTIGQHGSPWTADQARRRAIELLSQVRSGRDPAEDRTAARDDGGAAARAREARMFDMLADRWFEQHVLRGGLRSAKDIEGVLARDLKPAFAGKTIDEITKAVALEAIEGIGARSPDAGNKAFKWLRQLANWLIEKGVLTSSPLDRVSMPFPEVRRKRTLSLMELVVVWKAAGDLPEPFRSFYHLLILLGQRLREVSNLPWSEIEMDSGDWTLPAERTKNKNDHLIPLPDQAIAILETLQPVTARRRGPVLSTDGKVGIAGFSKLKERLDELITELVSSSGLAKALVGEGVAHWVVHDLRRSFATGCQALGVPLPVTEAVINHVSGSRSGIVGTYQLHEYYDEKADALQRWADLLEKAVTCWNAGDAPGVLALDPARRTRRRRARDGHG